MLFYEEASFLTVTQYRGAGVVICSDALRQPMEGSPQTLPRGLERKAGQQLQQHSIQIYLSVLIPSVGESWEFHGGSGYVRRVPPFPPNPATYVSHNSQSLPGTILLSVTYGIDVQSSEDPFLRIMLEATEAFAAATVPGRFLVNNFPIRASRCTRTVPITN